MDKTIEIRVTAEQDVEITAAAKRAGLPRSAFVRNAALEKARETK